MSTALTQRTAFHFIFPGGGEVLAVLERTGTPIGAYDLLIAGQALARDLVLVTHNNCKFERPAGLRIEG